VFGFLGFAMPYFDKFVCVDYLSLKVGLLFDFYFDLFSIMPYLFKGLRIDFKGFLCSLSFWYWLWGFMGVLWWFLLG